MARKVYNGVLDADTARVIYDEIFPQDAGLSGRAGIAPQDAGFGGQAEKAEQHNPVHTGEAEHHGHSHNESSQHAGGHHLLQVENLSIGFRMYDPAEPYFSAKQEYHQVISNLSISVHAGEIVAVVGASGSGKTLLADCVMGLFEPNAKVTGSIFYNGVQQSAASLAALRGHGMSLVPQSVDHLNPLMRVGKQVEGLGRGEGHHGRAGALENDVQARAERRKELFERYGLSPEVAQLYPHELSGGMARRVLLCCALMDNPKLLIADEPTPGLDLELAVRAMADFRSFADAGGGVMLITHDIELALRVADRVAVFKDGTIIEETSVESFRSPHTLRHPFTKALWHALPEHGFKVVAEKDCLDSTRGNPSGEGLDLAGRAEGGNADGIGQTTEGECPC